MMKLLFLLLTIAIGPIATAQKAGLVKQLSKFVLKGYGIKDTAFGDLNNDRKMDVALILYNLEEDQEDFEDTAMNKSRPLMLLLQKTDGKLQLAKRNDSLVMCKLCGGAMGDPYESLTIKNNGFMVSFYGGSSNRWGYTYGFSYLPTKQNWQLRTETQTNFQSTDPGATTTSISIPPSEISNLTIDNFNINTLNAPYDLTGTVVADRSYFYSNLNTATKRKAYVVKGNKVAIIRIFETFCQVYFTASNEKITTGYLLKKDIQIGQ